MKFILIDNFNGYINIICDDNGETLILDSYAEAKGLLNETCQNGIVVPLFDLMGVIEEAYLTDDVVEISKFEKLFK